MFASHRPFAQAALVFALLIAAPAGAATNATSPAPAAKGLDGVFYDDAYVMGSAKAKVTVVEYAYITCPHCARFDAQVFQDLKTRYIDTGKVRYEFREFLTEPAEIAASGFVIARCAGKDNYFKVVEEIFRAQPEMFSGRPGTEPVVVLSRISKANGVSDDKFRACLNDPKAIQGLNARLDKAIGQDKIDSTPTVLVNGKKIDPGVGEWSLAKISPAIDAALAKAR